MGKTIFDLTTYGAERHGADDDSERYFTCASDDEADSDISGYESDDQFFVDPVESEVVAATYDIPADTSEDVICAVRELGRQRRNFGEALQMVRDLKKSRGYDEVNDDFERRRGRPQDRDRRDDRRGRRDP